MDRVQSHKDSRQVYHRDKTHGPGQEVVDSRGKSKMKGVLVNNETLPAGKGQYLFPEGGAELVLLHYLTSEETILSSFPPEIRRGSSR